MKKTSLKRSNRTNRKGFTLIELLVVISIIAVLASLIAPAVQSARRAARKLECLNNIRQIGIAMQAFASSNGNLPSMTNDVQATNLAGFSGHVYGAAWPIALLPALDSTALLKNLRQNAVSAGGSGDAMIFTDQVNLKVMTCPDDTDSYQRPGGLSYVVNSGFIPSTIWGATESASLYQQPWIIDWNGDGRYSNDGITALGSPATLDSVDAGVETATGVFFRPSPIYSASLDGLSVGDGTTSTILVSENINAGQWYASRDSSTSPATVNHIAFGISIPVTSGKVNPGIFNGLSSLQTSNGIFDTTILPDLWQINRNLNSAVGAAPRPSSNHSGGVNTIFGDGSGKFLNESIDKGVYFKLLTSNGVNYGEQTLNQVSY